MTIFRMGTGPNQLVARTTYGDDASGNLFLEDLDGWDDFPEQQRNASDRVVGDGEWVSKYFRRKAKQLAITLAYKKKTGVRDLRAKLAYWESQNDFIRLEVERIVDGDKVVEVYPDCYITSPTLWKQTQEGFVKVNIAVKSPTPWKKVYINDAADPIDLL